MNRRIALLLLALVACSANAAPFALHVDAGARHGRLAVRFAYDHDGCPGANVRPTLHWSAPPPGTRSLAISVFDPDARTDHGGWWHWLVVDLPADLTALPGNVPLPAAAVQTRNDYGHIGWGGPCPPPGPAHRYVFTVYALDVAHLSVAPHAQAQSVAARLRAHTLGTASVTLRFGR